MQPDVLMMIALIGAHYFFDYAGQGDFMAKAKNPESPIPGVPWSEVMVAHAAIHGAAAALISGLWWVYIAELVIHASTDSAKCKGKIGYRTDQYIHLLSKVVWFLAAGGSL